MPGQAEREELLALTQYPCLAPSQSSDIEEQTNIKRSVIRSPIVVQGEVICPDKLLEKHSGAVLFLKTTRLTTDTSLHSDMCHLFSFLLYYFLFFVWF